MAKTFEQRTNEQVRQSIGDQVVTICQQQVTIETLQEENVALKARVAALEAELAKGGAAVH